uniref:Uncharacterized protein n=1 Tax=Anopheles melas TaxID=34690 RepID=A0A182UBQ9_9DIPT
MSGPPNINNNQLPPSSGGGGGPGSGRGWLRTPPPTYFRSPSPWVPPGSAPPRQNSPVTAGSSAGGPARGPSEFVYQHPSSGGFPPYGGPGGAAASSSYSTTHQQQYTTQTTTYRATTATPAAATAPAQEYQFQRPIPSAMTPTHFVASATHYRPVSPAAVAPQPYPQYSAPTMSPVSSLHRSMTPHSVASGGYGPPVDFHHSAMGQQQQVRPGSTQSSVYGGMTYHYGPAAGPSSHHPAQSQYVIYDYGGEMGPSTAEIIAAQSQDYVDEKLAEYQATIMLLQGECLMTIVVYLFVCFFFCVSKYVRGSGGSSRNGTTRFWIFEPDSIPDRIPEPIPEQIPELIL